MLVQLICLVWDDKSDRFKEIIIFYPGESLNIAYCQPKYVSVGQYMSWSSSQSTKGPEVDIYQQSALMALNTSEC